MTIPYGMQWRPAIGQMSEKATLFLAAKCPKNLGLIDRL
jgi:hypothetical protein